MGLCCALFDGEIAHQIGVHALVFQILQKLPKPRQLAQFRGLGQVARGGNANFIDDRLQRLHRRLDEFGHFPDADTRLAMGPVNAGRISEVIAGQWDYLDDKLSKEAAFRSETTRGKKE